MKRPILITAAIALAVVIGAFVWQASPDRGFAPTSSASIEVVDFRAAGSDVEPWSGRGLADELRAALATRRDVGMRVADSAGAGTADYVVTGSIARRGRRSEIGVQLTRRNGASVWSAIYWRPPDDLTSLSSEVVDALLIAVHKDVRAAASGR
jgi:TolB-like protein